VHGLGGLAEEVEGPLGHAGLERDRVRLLRVDEVGELDGVADEEDAEVVADEVPVAVLGVELHGEAARVTRGLRGVPATGHGREAQRDVGALALLLEELGAGVPADRLVADRAVGLEVPEGRHAAGVHDALRDALPVEVADLLEELVVLQGRRAACAHRPLVLVVVDRVALTVGQDRAVGLTGGGALRCDVGHAGVPPRLSC
jgi:hypothetical protein